MANREQCTAMPILPADDVRLRAEELVTRLQVFADDQVRTSVRLECRAIVRLATEVRDALRRRAGQEG